MSYYSRNKIKILKQNRLYRSRNRTKILKQKQLYRKKNTKKIQKSNAKYFLSNRDRLKKQQKNYRLKNKLKIDKWHANYRKHHKSKIHAQNIAQHIKIPKPKHCTICKKSIYSLIKHHPNYKFPLQIIWCCYSCHIKFHRSKKERKHA